jgi:putative tryptophan/tyrosine transport system substrate-binding protein
LNAIDDRLPATVEIREADKGIAVSFCEPSHPPPGARHDITAYQVGRPKMKRRRFIAGLLSATTIGTAQAQRSAKIYRIALVDPVHPTAEITDMSSFPFYVGFFEQLHRLGYFEGDNTRIERYSGDGVAERYPELAREVVNRNPDVIFVAGQRSMLDFIAATTTIPILGIMTDPVGLGMVKSVARPGGNVTGVSIDAGFEIYQKRLELLKEANSQISKVGLFLSRAVWEKTPLGAAMEEGAQRTGISLVWLSNGPLLEAEYRRAFAAMPREGTDALIVSEQAENWKHRQLIVELAAKGRLPAIYPFHPYVELGGLMAYGLSLLELGRRAADAVDQILRGAKPGDIPIYQPTRFELSINLRTARTLGIEMPSSLLVQADDVIE